MRTLTSLLGNGQKLDGGAMYGNAPKALWSRYSNTPGWAPATVESILASLRHFTAESTLADCGLKFAMFLCEIDQFVLGSRQPPIVGSPATVADRLQDWMQTTGVDGFNLSRTVVPDCLDAFIELVVPVLQERGVYKHAYAPGTYRDKLFGAGPRLPQGHPAAAHRW